MKSIHNDVVLGTSVAILAALGIHRALGFGADARVFPLLVLGPAVLLGLLIAVRGYLKQTRTGDNPDFFASPGRFFLVAGIMALALIGLKYLGFLTTSALTVPLLSVTLGYRRTLPILATTAGFLAMVYIVFIQILSRPLPAEIWTRLGGS
ncbi:tripartite tricarboxylate transporter TctB family protein [Rhodovulum sp. YEN HP10]|uniref:tripartite tricarboxylate transporter TctB family protein n=1 Tax=Rhodovulum sp. HP10 TaxID=3387397 RepID=UPI0039E103C9